MSSSNQVSTITRKRDAVKHEFTRLFGKTTTKAAADVGKNVHQYVKPPRYNDQQKTYMLKRLDGHWNASNLTSDERKYLQQAHAKGHMVLTKEQREKIDWEEFYDGLARVQVMI